MQNTWELDGIFALFGYLSVFLRAFKMFLKGCLLQSISTGFALIDRPTVADSSSWLTALFISYVNCCCFFIYLRWRWWFGCIFSHTPLLSSSQVPLKLFVWTSVRFSCVTVQWSSFAIPPFFPRDLFAFPRNCNGKSPKKALAVGVVVVVEFSRKIVTYCLHITLSIKMSAPLQIT